jgi:ABC-type glutathione transport system ATPase component
MLAFLDDRETVAAAMRSPISRFWRDICHPEVLTASSTGPRPCTPSCRYDNDSDEEAAVTPDVVHITGLEHSYGRTQALRGVELRVGAGECVALLGPNGAGKTTLVGALTGLIHQSAGSVEIDGASPQRAKTRARIGVVQQAVGFPRTLKVGELVSGWAIRMGKRSAAATPVLAEVGLDRPHRKYSHPAAHPGTSSPPASPPWPTPPGRVGPDDHANRTSSCSSPPSR